MVSFEGSGIDGCGLLSVAGAFAGLDGFSCFIGGSRFGCEIMTA